MTKKARRGNLTDRELIQKVREAEKAKTAATKAAALEAALKGEVIAEMQLRGTRAIEHDGTRVTLVAPERVSYDEPGLFSILTPAQRRRVFIENIDLNALPAATRKKIIEVVPKRQRADVTTRSLDLTALSLATQAGEIDQEMVASVSEVVPSKPYYRTSEVK
jgi:hypothetical protein